MVDQVLGLKFYQQQINEKQPNVIEVIHNFTSYIFEIDFFNRKICNLKFIFHSKKVSIAIHSLVWTQIQIPIFVIPKLWFHYLWSQILILIFVILKLWFPKTFQVCDSQIVNFKYLIPKCIEVIVNEIQ